MALHLRPDILLVEDNPGDVRLFKEALKVHKAEANLTVVDNGEDAIRHLRKEGPFASAKRPNLVVLDLNLPRKDGREVLAEIKADPELRRIPVVVFTTSGAASDINHAYDLHANCYIRKPPGLDAFLEVIRSCEMFWLSVVCLPSQ